MSTTIRERATAWRTPAPEGAPGPSHGPRGSRAVLGAILVLAAGLRLGLLASIIGRLDGDEAASGIQAQRILEGARPLYFPDPYAYFGSLEQYLQAPLLALDPGNPFLLRLPQVALSVASCALVALLARRCLRRPWAGEVAAACFAVGPFYALAWSFKTRTYAAALFLGLAGLVLALGTDPAARRARLRAAVFGLTCGVAFWTNWTSAFLLLPAGLWWLGAVRPRLVRLVPPAVAGFALGALPFAITAAQGRLPTIFDRIIRDSSVAERAQALFGPVLAMFVGVRRAPPAGVGEAVVPAPAVWVAVALAMVVVAAVARRSGLFAMVTLRPSRARPGDVLLLAALLVPPLYVASSFAFLTLEPRYLFVLYGLLPVGLAALVPTGRRRWGGVAAVLVIGALAASTAHGVRVTYTQGGAAPDDRTDIVATERLPQVVDALEAEGVGHAWADYWLAHPLRFLARERLVVASWYSPRFEDDYDAVQASATPAYVAVAGPEADEVVRALEAAGVGYRRREVAGFSLFLDLDPAVSPTRRRADLTRAELAPVEGESSP